jgi:hypothetical protein
MSIQYFLNIENIKLLWEVLLEEPLIKQYFDTSDKYKELSIIFESNIKGFYEIEKNNCNNLIELNKKFILLIMNWLFKQSNIKNIIHINKTIPEIKENSRKITIHEGATNDIINDTSIKELITYEEIKNERVTQFEKELSIKQSEFTNIIKKSVPPTPNFSDKVDEPIYEIDLEIKKIQEQRNYDIEIINKNHQKNITAQKSGEKHISWADNHVNGSNDIQNDNILSKLKKTNDVFYDPNSIYENNNIINETNETNQVNELNELNLLKNEVATLKNNLNILIEKFENFIDEKK